MDELIAMCRDNQTARDYFEKIIRDSIQEVSDEFLVRRDLGCDVAFGRDYGSIH